MSGYRLASGGLIDRTKPLFFTFDGRRLAGFEGDTLASALLASGVGLVGRSFKYHRPRGVFSAGPEEPNALVELGEGARRTPNTRATEIELVEGLVASSQNRWPSLDFDLMAVTGLVGAFLPAGFYYKTFMWPSALWERLYEPSIRRAAGLGSASGEPDPDAYDGAHAFCDLLVIGSGPAGLAAALTAGRAGARVILCELDARVGGRLLSERQGIDALEGAEWAAQAAAELAGLPGVRVMTRTQVFGAYDGGVFGALEKRPAGLVRERLWKIAARHSVLAAGAVERPIVFGGNDLPGVMLASAARTYLGRFGVAPGRKAAVFTAGDDGLRTARDLEAAGVEVVATLDARAGGFVSRASGRLGLSRIVTNRGALEVDLLAVSGGWNPQLALTSHQNARPVWDDEIAGFVPGEPPPGMRVVGAARGRFSLAAALADGAEAAVAACGDLGRSATAPFLVAEEEGVATRAYWRVPSSYGKAFVDLQNDVTDKDVELAVREGFASIEHLKRYTTLGMGTDQGKTSNVIGHALLAELTGKPRTELGSVLSRPPQYPVAIGALAGQHRGKDFRPTRLPPSHAWAAGQGASFVESGAWLRAEFYPRPAERDWLESTNREVMAVRTGVGVCDVSTLGKIDIQGPGAAALLDFVYINTVSTLPVGRARYGVMLREDGFVFDDGTTARLGDAHFVMSTTTANAARVMQHLEFCHQALRPELDLAMVSVTEQWAQFSVAGPGSRVLLQDLIGQAFDLSDAALPYMGAVEGRVGDLPVRLFRLSFSGELAFEIAVPAPFGEALMRQIVEAGATPYGTEALGAMRIEKGHVGGGELNGQTTAQDLGLGRMMSGKKDFIGRLLAGRPGLRDAARPSLVGVRPIDPAVRIRPGAHFLAEGAGASWENDLGHLTSAAYSPSLQSWIGLGLLSGGLARKGERVRAHDPVRGADVVVEVCEPCFLDPEGRRLHA